MRCQKPSTHILEFTIQQAQHEYRQKNQFVIKILKELGLFRLF